MLKREEARFVERANDCSEFPGIEKILRRLPHCLGKSNPGPKPIHIPNHLKLKGENV
jgi:hypothetical protein